MDAEQSPSPNFEAAGHKPASSSREGSLARLLNRIRTIRGLEWIVAAVLAAYVFWFRTHEVSQSFNLGGDQVRDWQVALRPFTSLPLSGVSSTAGGNTIGPVYYWILWCIARIAHPFVGYLPHAGGLGIAALQSIGDAALFVALRARLKSWPTAVLIVLGAATSAYDATLSATIWNPPVAVALVKLALASQLWRRRLTTLTAATAVSASWLAVQCHTSALVIALPAIGLVVAEPLVERRWRSAASRLALVVSIVLVLQVPWLISSSRHSSGRPSGIIDSISQVIASPQQSIHPSASAELVARSLDFILLAPATLPLFGQVLVVTGTLIVLVTRDAALIAGSVMPTVTAILLFSLWQGRLDQVYWFLVLAPAAAIMLAGWVPSLHRCAWIVSSALVVALLLAQPARAQMAWTYHRMPGYGAMVQGCRTIANDGRPVRDIQLAFSVSVSPNVLWLCSILGAIGGGAADPIAYIDASGDVLYR